MTASLGFAGNGVPRTRRKEFVMMGVREIESAYLRRVIQQRGISDQQVLSLLIVERYFREPEPTNSVVTLMLSAIDRDYPAEAAVVRRELESVKAEPKAQIKESQANAGAKHRALQARLTAAGGASAAPHDASPTRLVEKPNLLEASKRSLALVPIPVRVEEQGANTSSAVVPNPFQPDKADDRGSCGAV